MFTFQLTPEQRWVGDLLFILVVAFIVGGWSYEVFKLRQMGWREWYEKRYKKHLRDAG